MKKLACLCAMLALLAALPAWAEMTALDAFHALLEEEPAETGAVECLDAVMAGNRGPEGDAEALALWLEALSAVTAGDIADYASRHDLPVAQVRNAWYRALAQALTAELAVNPENEARDRNALAILALFLEPDGDEAEKRDIRSQMSPEKGSRIAEQSALPRDFVEFVIMSDDWDDEDWKNDGDWRQTYGWLEDFEDIAIGSRDAPGETRIADMQSALISLGYLKGKADGVFGPRTQSALIEFQLANGLAADGSFDSDSANRLRAADAVARWDYDRDFWDSDDPDTPDSPDTPDAKKKADTPDTPDTGNKADTPDTPDSPDDD